MEKPSTPIQFESDDEIENRSPKKIINQSNVPTAAAPFQNETHNVPQNNLMAISMEQLQLLLASTKVNHVQGIEHTIGNLFYDAANEVAKLKHYEICQLPGILTTFAGKNSATKELFLALVKVAYLATKYDMKKDEVRLFIIEFLRDIGSFSSTYIETNLCAFIVSIIQYRAQVDAAGACFVARNKRAREDRFKRDEKDTNRNKPNNPQTLTNTRPPLA